jgi:hypothetical protein
MKKIKGLVAISAFALLVLGLPAVASAQWNGGYGNGGYYGNNANIRSAVKRLKDKAKRFENSVDRYDDRNDDRRNRGGWGNWGNGNSDSLERLTNQFKNAADDLEDAYGGGRNMNNSVDEARRVLNLASAIDQQIYNARGGRNLQGQWNSMRQELNIIAGAYGYNNGYPNRNNRNRNGGRRSNFPF